MNNDNKYNKMNQIIQISAPAATTAILPPRIMMIADF